MKHDAVGTGRLAYGGSMHGVRKTFPAGIPERGNVININEQSSHDTVYLRAV